MFLSRDQLQQISKYCLYKLIEPSDKIEELSSFNDTNYMHIKTSPVYDLLPIDGHFSIEKKISSAKFSYLYPMLNEKSPVPLKRDLDLYVVNPSGSILVGDHVKNDTKHLSTNEKVIIDNALLVEGNYRIHIFAGKFLDSTISKKEDLSQEFSVVVTGDINNQRRSFTRVFCCCHKSKIICFRNHNQNIRI